MQDVEKILKWGHSNLKVPYIRLAEEITASGKGKGTTEKIKLLFFPFKSEGTVVADVSNHFYPPLMESPVVNAVMIVTKSLKKGILRMYTEEYDIGSLTEDPAKTTATMFVEDYKPTLSQTEMIEGMLQKQNYQGILDFMERESTHSWNCLKIGSLEMLEEMKLIEEISARTGDFLDFFFQTIESLQKLYSTGNFYVFPEERFPLFYFWQNYFGYWTKDIDYKSLKLLFSQLLWNQRLSILMDARDRPLFNLLVNINNGKISMEMIPPHHPFSDNSTTNKVVSRSWNSINSIEMLKSLMKSHSLKELFINAIPYFVNLTFPRERKKEEKKPKSKTKRPKLLGFLSKSDIENLLLEFTRNLNDGDKIWTVLLDNITPLFGFESEIRESFPASITGLNEKQLNNALELAIPSNDIKMKVLLDSNYILRLRTELLKGDIPEKLKTIENFLLEGLKICPQPTLIESIESKGLLTSLYRLMTRKKKQS